MRRKIILTKEFLYEEVIKKRKPFHKIATEFMVAAPTIKQKMQEFGLIRANSCYECSKQWLIEQNYENCLVLGDIAKLLSVSPTIIARQMKKHGLEPNIRRFVTKEFLYEEVIRKRRFINKVAEEIGCKGHYLRYSMKKYGLLKVERNYECSADWLIEQNHTKKLFLSEIAKMIDCCPGRLQKEFRKHGVALAVDCERKYKAKSEETAKRLIGKKFHSITVISFHHKERRHKYWSCSCICGKQMVVSTDSLEYGDIKSCGCRQRTSKFKSVGDLTGAKWRVIARGAKSRNLEFTITQEYAWELFIKQSRRCALTGVLLYMPSRYSINKHNKNSTSCVKASLDRIDSSLGYIPGNVQWVSWNQNKMKQNLSEDVFLRECMLNVVHQLKKRKKQPNRADIQPAYKV